MCVFCEKEPLFENAYAKSFYDKYPVTVGHTLIIPKRHVESYFDLTRLERVGLCELIDIAREDLSEEFNPDGYNIGINDGKSAGQTVSHTHIHVIPRYRGDVADPMGGVRGVIPEKQKYESEEN